MNWPTAAIVACLAFGCGRREPVSFPTLDELDALPSRPIAVPADSVHHPLLDAQAVNVADGVSPDEAAIVAVAGNVELRAARASRGLARAQLIAAGVLPDPSLTLGLDAPTAGTTSGTSPGYSAELAWDLGALYGRAARRRSAKANAAGVELDIAWQEWQVALQAKGAVYDLLALDQALAIVRTSQGELADEADKLERAYAKQLTTATAATSARVALDDARSQVAALEHERSTRYLDLLALLGMAPETQLTLEEAVLPAVGDIPNREALFRGIDDRRLDLLALRRGYESEAATYRAAVLERFPRIGVAGHVARDTADLITVGATLTITLPTFDRNRGAIAEADATKARLRDEYRARVHAARFEIAGAIADLRGLSARIAVANASVDALEAALKPARDGFEAQLVDAYEYFGRRADVIAKRLELVRLRQEWAHALIRLEAATGLFDITAGGSS